MGEYCYDINKGQCESLLWKGRGQPACGWNKNENPRPIPVLIGEAKRGSLSRPDFCPHKRLEEVMNDRVLAGK